MSAKSKPSKADATRALRVQKYSAPSSPEQIRQRDLDHHERIIAAGQRSFVEMGQSLDAIRSKRLYGKEFDTFAEYCDERWEMTAAQANRLIAASKLVIAVTPIGVEINSEAVARELVPLIEHPEKVKAVYDEAVRRACGGRVTAKLVGEVRRALYELDGEVVKDPEPPAEDPMKDFQHVQDLADAAARGGEEETSQAGDDVTQAAEVDSGAGTVRPASPSTTDDTPAGESSTEGDSVYRQPGSDHREGTAGPTGDAADESTPSVDDDGDESDSEPGEASLSGDTEQQRAGSGVALPAAAPKRVLSDEEVERRAQQRTQRIGEALVALWGTYGDHPAEWFEQHWRREFAHHARDMPRVAEIFTPDGIRRIARNLNDLADWAEKEEFQL
jgi:hypothetical protein